MDSFTNKFVFIMCGGYALIGATVALVIGVEDLATSCTSIIGFENGHQECVGWAQEYIVGGGILVAFGGLLIVAAFMLFKEAKKQSGMVNA